MPVVDASIIARLLLNRRDDQPLRERLRHYRDLHVPHLIDAEVTSAIRGLLITTKPSIQVDAVRAQEMLDDFADLPLVRYPMLPYQRRVLALRNNFTAYDGFYVALPESLAMPLDHRPSKIRRHTRPHPHHRNLVLRIPASPQVRSTLRPPG